MLLRVDNIWQHEYDKNPLYDSRSKKWVATSVQDTEVVVCRQNFGHGMLSLGWDDPDKKFILYYSEDNHKKGNSKVVWNRMIRLSQGFADLLNNLDKE